MGNITFNKGLLLDERDLDGPPHAGLESLAERIHDHLVEEFEPEDGWPLLEILGVASERFGATHGIANLFAVRRLVRHWV